VFVFSGRGGGRQMLDERRFEDGVGVPPWAVGEVAEEVGAAGEWVGRRSGGVRGRQAWLGESLRRAGAVSIVRRRDGGAHIGLRLME